MPPHTYSILRLEGTLSASMNYILGLLSPAMSCTDLTGGGNGNSKATPTLSQAVAEAARLQLLERSSPMNDLDGIEMAQKLLVLGKSPADLPVRGREDRNGMSDVSSHIAHNTAREMGLPLRLEDVQIETLLPKGTTIEDLPKHDAAVAKRIADASSRGNVLR